MSPLRMLAAAALIVTGGALQAGTAPDPDVVSGLTSSWEVLWHQSGAPTRVARWEKPIVAHITGTPAQRAEIVAMLDEVTKEAGRTWSEGEDANLDITVVANNKLEDNQPCVTYIDMDSETQEIETVTTQMRRSDVHRCVAHELMHAMGLRGHPSGQTVLSYFKELYQLQPLDRMFLRAWYSPAMKAGMSPFEAIPVLADEVVCGAKEPEQALVTRNAFMVSLVAEMQRYVDGQSEGPAVIKRSGKATATGLKVGRMQMARFMASRDGSLEKQASALSCKSALIYRASTK